MNIAGCDFLCQNKDCSRFEQKIGMFSKWPLVDIDFLIDLVEDQSFKNKLIHDKFMGRQVGIMVYPTDIKHEVLGFCFNGWCPAEKKVYVYDVLNKDYSDEYTIPNISEQGNKIYSFQECLEAGISCPFCGTEMRKEKWFVSTVK